MTEKLLICQGCGIRLVKCKCVVSPMWQRNGRPEVKLVEVLTPAEVTEHCRALLAEVARLAPSAEAVCRNLSREPMKLPEPSEKRALTHQQRWQGAKVVA